MQTLSSYTMNLKMTKLDKPQILYTKLFQIGCIILTVIMTYEQFLKYSKNEDSSSVSFRGFNHEEKDVYPTFSLCMHSTEGAIMKGSPDFEGSGTPTGVEMYQKMLTGNEELRKEFHAFEFNDNTVDVLDDFVSTFVSYTKQGHQIDHWTSHQGKNKSNSSPFYKSYQDPYHQCISKSVKFVRGQVLHHDYLVLNARNLHNYIAHVSNDNTTNLFLYVHHPGQLIREFGKQSFQLNLLDFYNAIKKTNNYREIHISQVDVVRKRADGVVPCNDEIHDENEEWLSSVIQETKCIPQYWKGALRMSSSTPHLDLPNCNTSDQYRNIHDNYLPPNNFESGEKLYSGTCNQMRTTLNIIQNDLPLADDVLILEISYNSEEYRETLSYRAFGRYWTQKYYVHIINSS